MRDRINRTYVRTDVLKMCLNWTFEKEPNLNRPEDSVFLKFNETPTPFSIGLIANLESKDNAGIILCIPHS